MLSPIEKLPNEIILSIFRHAPEALFELSHTCHKFNTLLKSELANSLWSQKLTREIPFRRTFFSFCIDDRTKLTYLRYLRASKVSRDNFHIALAVANNELSLLTGLMGESKLSFTPDFMQIHVFYVEHINGSKSKGDTPIDTREYAALCGNLEIFQRLVDYGRCNNWPALNAKQCFCFALLKQRLDIARHIYNYADNYAVRQRDLLISCQEILPLIVHVKRQTQSLAQMLSWARDFPGQQQEILRKMMPECANE